MECLPTEGRLLLAAAMLGHASHASYPAVFQHAPSVQPTMPKHLFEPLVAAHAVGFSSAQSRPALLLLVLEVRL